MNCKEQAMTVGFQIRIQRRDRERVYSPSVSSFGRYCRACRSMGWQEQKMGLGVSIRKPR